MPDDTFDFSETEAFIQQNTITMADLTAEEIAPHAHFYAGGSFVLSGTSKRPDFIVKMHDSWDSDEIVVHEYHLDDPDNDDYKFYAPGKGREAFEDFLGRLA